MRTTAIRRNPASPLIKYALRAWVESRASAASGGGSALLSRKRPGLRLSAKAANRNGATVFGSEFASNKRKRTSKAGCPLLTGAGNEARTRYLHLGKVALYQMSYARGTRVILAKECPLVKYLFSDFQKFLQFLLPPFQAPAFPPPTAPVGRPVPPPPGQIR